MEGPGSNSHYSLNPDLADLQHLTTAATPRADAFHTILDRVAANPDPLPAHLARTYTDACHRYTELTGHIYSPPVNL